MKELTNRQLEILRYIRDFSDENACPPTIREISARFEISLRATQDHIAALEKKEYLSAVEKRSRSLRVLIDPDEVYESDYNSLIDIPLLGSVAAGKPLLTSENLHSYIRLPVQMLKPHASYFALRVSGNSMIGAGIFDGDTAIIEQCQTAKNGDIVVAVIDEAITLKRFFKEDARIRLQAENPAFNPIYCQNVRIAGKLATIIRKY